jgi:uncharacterized protein YaaR (DUF327 family)
MEISISHAADEANVIVAFLPQLPDLMEYAKLKIKAIYRRLFMRIKDASTARDIIKKVEKNSSSPKGTASLFASKLAQQQYEPGFYEGEIDELRKEIEQFGEALEKEPTLSNFGKFRESLSRLAKKITNEAYRLEKIGGTPQNPRYFEIITIINAEADRLYDLIIRENKNHLAIAAKVINIKGMVVDLIT